MTPIHASYSERALTVLALRLLLFCLAFAPSSQVLAGTVVDAVPRQGFEPPDPERAQREHNQRRLEQLRPLVEESRQGKRDDAEKYVILRHFIQTHVLLGTAESAEAKAARKDWDALLKKHPEFKTNPPPLEIREQRERREREDREARGIEMAAQSFVPQDSRAKVFWSGRHLAAVFQFRAEFYELPGGVQCLHEYGGKWQPIEQRDESDSTSGSQGATISLRFMRAGQDVTLKPRKTVTFSQNVDAVGSCSWSSKECPYVAIFTENVQSGYSPSDENEERILRHLEQTGKPYQWRNPSADFHEFYGVFSIDGTLEGQLQFKATPPNSLIKVLQVYPDGTALFVIGSAVPDADDSEYLRFGDAREVISWSKKGTKREPLAEALEKHPQLRKSPWIR